MRQPQSINCSSLHKVLTARKAFLQKKSRETEYYNSDDEDEHLCTATPTDPNPQYNLGNYNTIAESNQYLAKQEQYYSKCTPQSTTPYSQPTTHNLIRNLPYSQPTTPYSQSTTPHNVKPTYSYSQNICNLKYVPPATKTTFSLAYKKPISKVYVYNNYIQNLDKCEKKYNTKNYCIPSTTKATYKCR